MISFFYFNLTLLSLVFFSIVTTLSGIKSDERRFAISTLETEVKRIAQDTETQISEFMDFIEENATKSPDQIEKAAEKAGFSTLFHLIKKDENHFELENQWSEEKWSKEKIDQTLTIHGMNTLRFNTQQIVVEYFGECKALIGVFKEKPGLWMTLLEINTKSTLDEAFKIFLINDVGQTFGESRQIIAKDFLAELSERLLELKEEIASKQWSFDGEEFFLVYKKLIVPGLTVTGWIESQEAYRKANALSLRLGFGLLGLICFFNAFLLLQKKNKKS